MRSQTAAPLHAPVGIFIEKNNRETMAARFCNRRYAARPRYASAVMPTELIAALPVAEVGEALVEAFVEDVGQVGVATRTNALPK
jgi:hypothetical protein